MKKIQYCSVLHLEFQKDRNFLTKNPIKPVGDIMILAGDIVPFVALKEHNRFFDELSEKFETVFWVPGNHEFYHSDLIHYSEQYNKEIRKNIFLVHNQVIKIDNLKLVFSTLWTKISEQNSYYIEKIV